MVRRLVSAATSTGASRSGSRILLLLTAALLLAGQGSALHHHHRAIADGPSGPRLDDVSHAAPSSGDRIAPDDTCPLCEMLGQARTAVPAPESGFAPAPSVSLTSPAPDAQDPFAPSLPGLRARAPPRPA